MMDDLLLNELCNSAIRLSWFAFFFRSSSKLASCRRITFRIASAIFSSFSRSSRSICACLSASSISISFCFSRIQRSASNSSACSTAGQSISVAASDCSRACSAESSGLFRQPSGQYHSVSAALLSTQREWYVCSQ
uniref:(northern house mosquito) hypothetical protein n=1 Tax=Culex pipiens TaxID=7175 RepID=A0A8D8KNH1_CULPI